VKKSEPKRPSPSKITFDDLLMLNAEWFDWIEDAVKFESLLKDRIPWESLDGPGRSFVTRRLKSTAPARQLLLNSFYLTMISGFEDYLRTTIRDITRSTSKTLPRYEDLPEPIRKMHIRESARLLKRMDSPPDYLNLNIEELCRGIGSCVPGSTVVSLSAEAFADVESLIKLDTFIDRLGVLGIRLTMDILSLEQSLKDSLKLPKANTRQVSKALKDELETMARYRNRIAHTGGNAAEVTIETLKEHRILLLALTSAIESVL
jgi:hypothetical protein